MKRHQTDVEILTNLWEQRYVNLRDSRQITVLSARWTIILFYVIFILFPTLIVNLNLTIAGTIWTLACWLLLEWANIKMGKDLSFSELPSAASLEQPGLIYLMMAQFLMILHIAIASPIAVSCFLKAELAISIGQAFLFVSLPLLSISALTVILKKKLFILDAEYGFQTGLSKGVSRKQHILINALLVMEVLAFISGALLLPIIKSKLDVPLSRGFPKLFLLFPLLCYMASFATYIFVRDLWLIRHKDLLPSDFFQEE